MKKIAAIISCILPLQLQGEFHMSSVESCHSPFKSYSIPSELAEQSLVEIVNVWTNYLEGKDWQQLIENVTPKKTENGLIYELANPLDRPNESFAIADMRAIQFSEPHYHGEPETEIYIILQGSGLVVIGEKEHLVQKGSILIIPPNIAHFTIPKDDLVFAVINTPPFRIENYIPVKQKNETVRP